MAKYPYQISSKSIQWLMNRFMWTDGWTDGWMERQINRQADR
jgi:hypothetical protein